MAIQLVHRQRREIVDRVAPFARFDALPFEPVALGCVQPKVQGFDRFSLSTASARISACRHCKGIANPRLRRWG